MTTLLDRAAPASPALLARHGTAAALLAFALTAVVGVLARPLLPIDETRYMTVAWEMWLSGDHLVPHLNGAIYSDKPPLLFWLINLVWSVTGVSETAARLVGPAFGLGTIALTARLARRLWPDDAGIGGRAALVLSGFASFALFAGLTMFDAMLAFAVVLGLWALVETRRTYLGWIGLGAALALGTFAKGPVVLVHVLPLALAAPLLLGISWGALARGLPAAVAVALALVALWLVPALIEGGPVYREAVLWTQSAGRVTHAFAHQRGWWFFLALLPILTWPFAWSGALWRRLRDPAIRRDAGLRFAAAWALSAVVLFSLISGKQVHYLVPTMPAFALAFARLLGPAFPRDRAAALIPAVGGLALLALSLDLVPVGRQADLTHPAWVWAVGGVFLLALAAVLFRARGPVLAAAGPALVIAADLVMAATAFGHIYSPHPIGDLIGPHDKAGVALLAQPYHGEWTFAGRLTRPIEELPDAAAADRWMADHPGGAVIARTDGVRPAGDPSAEVVFRDRPYGVWVAP